MAHMVEIIDGNVSLAYSGKTPWHNLGTKVSDDLTPTEMLQAANLDWEVRKEPAFLEINGRRIETGHSGLVRSSDDKVLDIITDDWNPVQNQEAFEFFDDFIKAGNMQMHTAGALKGGRIVWALAKVGEGFSVFGGDEVESYLLFTNPHQYGQSTDIRFTNIRVVCNNTLTLALKTLSSNSVKVSHARQFDPAKVKETMGIAKSKLQQYKEMAEFLGSKRYDQAMAEEYFKTVFPGTSKTKEYSKNAIRALNLVDTQPGAEFAPGTFWNLFNSVTFMTDHLIGRSEDSRLTSAWFGPNKSLKLNALNKALDMAADA